LVARGDGVIHRLTWSGDSLVARRLDVEVPLHRAAFAAAAGEAARVNRFRVADLLVRDGGDTITVLASHHHWRPEDGCFTVRLSRVELPAAALKPGASVDVAWRTVHETRPCLPFKTRGRNGFAGHEMGGRLAFLDPRRVLMTVGDHEFDGYNSNTAAAQEAGWEYGRTLLIDLATGEAEVFALGQRNPQGLFVDGAGTVWSTEHGPQGGDELNRLVRGGNYGWPYRTWGTDYGALSWPLADTARDPSFREPVYAWVPSVGISSLLAVEGPGFTRWRGDLVVASLTARTLWRIRVDHDRVAFVEPLEIGSRVRDLVEGPDGALVLWTDSADVIRLEPAEDREEGVALFQRYCGACHKTGNEQAFAPNLAGVVDRPVGGSEGFDYSPALERMEGRWTEGRLRAFLREPLAVAPGTTMEFAGVRDPEHVDAIIRYLGTLGGPSGVPVRSDGRPGG
ncbi:MAG: PQQ-dependent sugar dehydrogenase, partial [Gemmatimonadota bacterium]